MSDYRDDVGALRARIESLQQQLAEAKAAERRGANDAASEQLADAEARVASLEAELRRARAERAAEPWRTGASAPQRGTGNKPVVTGLLVVVLGSAAILSLHYATRGDPAGPPSYSAARDQHVEEQMRRARRLADCSNACSRNCPPDTPAADPSGPFASSCLVDCLSRCDGDGGSRGVVGAP